MVEPRQLTALLEECLESIVKRAARLAILAVLTIATADHLQTNVSGSDLPALSKIRAQGVVPVESYLRSLAESTWPDVKAEALGILHCESRIGADPDAWRVDAPDGGPYQINRASWETFFRERHGWTWMQITHDPAINTAAAKIIYDRTGDWSAWSCADQLTTQASPD
jgi:hypothetical protein